MVRALGLAQAQRLVPPPNPAVGCVLVGADGRWLAEGATQAAGSAHAEVMALRDAESRQADVRGATAHVSLEPCSHQGRTGPCCDALIAAGMAKVVVAVQDPNPAVAGRGIARLRAAGIEVELLPDHHPAAMACQALNIGFFSRMLRGLPWVRLKVAASLDGRTALDNGSSQWITSTPARADGHAWRARACVVLTGIGTVLEDNPRLDVREVPTPRQPHLVIVDSALQTPLEAALWQPGRQVWIYGAADDEAARARAHALRGRGAEVRLLPVADGRTGKPGKVDLAALMRDLAGRGANEVHVEAGHKLNGSMLREGLVDELLVYLAPKLIGPGPGLAQWPALTALDAATALRFGSVTAIGPDLRLLARARDAQRFLPALADSAQTLV
ncbi:MAG: hypothetical protein RLZZ126_1263 [Pseudomonadota bacterium]|jgi:diaminohydroxyphosphoribosylaminopyrimidine deaminase/5-amino-6-(5-phosphoribosylamino)uracil reductase